MPVPSKIPVPSPTEIDALLFPDGKKNAPVLPKVWRAKVLLTPPGGVNIGGASEDELFAGILTYDGSSATPLLRAQLYALDSLRYFDFLFGSYQGSNLMWLLKSTPDKPDDPVSSFSPAFQCDVVVPAGDAISSQFSHAGSWKVVGTHCHGFSGKKTAQPSTWVWQDSVSAAYKRIMNVDPSNDFSWPVFGSFYFVDFATFDSLANSTLPSLFTQAPKGAAPANLPIRTFAALASAMTSPALGGATACKFPDIQSILPGLLPGNGAIAPPAWTAKIHSQCFMIGQDPYPYYCQLWYDWTTGCQVTVFVQKGDTGAYDARFDEFLPKGKVGPAIVYTWSGTEWDATCSQDQGGVVPMPVPDFVKAASGRCRALFKGSSYFGNLSVWSVILGDQNHWSDFWYWFDEAQRGVVFSLAPASSLTLIDYQSFDQNGTIPADVLVDPTPSIPACTSENLMALTRRPRFRPPKSIHN